MEDTRNAFLIAGALLSALAAALHVGCIVFGAPWYRFFGAGERMAQMAIAGNWYPTVVTAVIALFWPCGRCMRYPGLASFKHFRCCGRRCASSPQSICCADS